MSKMSARLAELDEKIEFWQKVCSDFPQSGIYAKNLRDLQTERAEIAAEIGRKKFLIKKRSVRFNKS